MGDGTETALNNDFSEFEKPKGDKTPERRDPLQRKLLTITDIVGKTLTKIRDGGREKINNTLVSAIGKEVWNNKQTVVSAIDCKDYLETINRNPDDLKTGTFVWGDRGDSITFVDTYGNIAKFNTSKIDKTLGCPGNTKWLVALRKLGFRRFPKETSVEKTSVDDIVLERKLLKQVIDNFAKKQAA